MDFEDWTSTEIELAQLGIKANPPAPHRSIFKFISLGTKTSYEKLAATFQSNRLRGSTVNSMNDPFEHSPVVVQDFSTVGDVEKYLPKKLDPKFGLTLDQDWKVEQLIDDALDFISTSRDRTQIVSFSERVDTPLLWAHYAKNYEGACLHFLSKGFRLRRNSFSRVAYEDERPIYPLSLALQLQQRRHSPSQRAILKAESDRMLHFTKAKDWSYECEVRATHDRYDDGVAFEPSSLVSIIFGPKCPDKEFEKAKSLVRESRRNIKMFRAQLSDSTYSVTIPWDRPEAL